MGAVLSITQGYQTVNRQRLLSLGDKPVLLTSPHAEVLGQTIPVSLGAEPLIEASPLASSFLDYCCFRQSISLQTC